MGLGLVFVLGLEFRFELGFGKLIGGAVGTVGWVFRKPPVSEGGREWYDNYNDFYLHSRAAKRPDSRTKLCRCSSETSKTVQRYTMQKH